MRKLVASWPPPRARGAAAAALCLLLTGCSTCYVLRAGYEEFRILWRRQAIEKLLAGEADPQTRAKLELILAVRRFARERLGLSVGGSYASVSRVGGDQIVYLVTAAPRDRLELRTWWYPVVGRVPYRGYFDRGDAEALAARLRRDGDDTYLRPAVAFSTLGWFDDPLPSNLLRRDEVTLAGVILHELLHRTIYLRGQGSFNESFANFAGWRGAAEFFAARREMPRARAAEAAWADEVTFSERLEDLVARLRKAYGRGVGLAERDVLLKSWQEELAAIEWRTERYTDLGGVHLNNAVVLHYHLYARELRLFEQAYAAHGHRLRATIAWVRTTVEDASDPFAALRAAVQIPSARTAEARPVL